jgi:hypothetical protein
LVHDWIQLPSASQEWNRIDIWIDFDRLKMNHYAFLSVEEANLKAVQNGNPMCTLAMMYAQTAADLSLAAFDKEQDAFFSKEEDTGCLKSCASRRSLPSLIIGPSAATRTPPRRHGPDT